MTFTRLISARLRLRAEMHENCKEICMVNAQIVGKETRRRCREDHLPDHFWRDDISERDWEVIDNDDDWTVVRCRHCGEESSYEERNHEFSGRVELVEVGSARACPTPGKVRYVSEGYALVDAEVQAERYDKFYAAYECRCGSWHLTSGARR